MRSTTVLPGIKRLFLPDKKKGGLPTKKKKKKTRQRASAKKKKKSKNPRSTCSRSSPLNFRLSAFPDLDSQLQELPPTNFSAPRHVVALRKYRGRSRVLNFEMMSKMLGKGRRRSQDSPRWHESFHSDRERQAGQKQNKKQLLKQRKGETDRKRKRPLSAKTHHSVAIGEHLDFVEGQFRLTTEG